MHDRCTNTEQKLITDPYCTMFVLNPVWMYVYMLDIYSGTLLNGHPSMADTHDITDNSESPDRFSIEFNTLETPE